MLQRFAAGVRWHCHLASAARTIHETADISQRNVKKGLDAVAETAQDEALESVLASRHAMVPALLAAGVACVSMCQISNVCYMN